MRVEKTASFAEILGSIHAPDETWSIGGKKIAEEAPAPAERDSLQLSIQGEIALGRRRRSGRQNAGEQPQPEYDTRADQQGNSVKISSHASLLAGQEADNVAWETGRNPRAKQAP